MSTCLEFSLLNRSHTKDLMTGKSRKGVLYLVMLPRGYFSLHHSRSALYLILYLVCVCEIGSYGAQSLFAGTWSRLFSFPIVE
jgi:hypothetical protein